MTLAHLGIREHAGVEENFLLLIHLYARKTSERAHFVTGARAFRGSVLQSGQAYGEREPSAHAQKARLYDALEWLHAGSADQACGNTHMESATVGEARP